MSAAPASATSAPTKANEMRVSGAQLVLARKHGAPAAAAGSPRGGVAAASDSLEAKQRFVAYAAHELRSLIALQRALAEVALTNPHADTSDLREMGERVVVACERQERLLAALLTLSRSHWGRLRREPVDLAATAAEVQRVHDHHGIVCSTALAPARTTGDPQLLERLVANLVANAVRHNLPGGRLEIATYTTDGRATFAIANTGPVIPSEALSRLFQPFQRVSSQAGRSGDGVGLGLALVQAIANAHHASVTATPRTGGGLVIDVAFIALD